MSELKREGPYEQIIPEQRQITCSGCKWLNNVLIKSGKDPIRSYNCTHKDAISKHLGNLEQNILTGEITPGSWCPFEISQNYFGD